MVMETDYHTLKAGDIIACSGGIALIIHDDLDNEDAPLSPMWIYTNNFGPTRIDYPLDKWVETYDNWIPLGSIRNNDWKKLDDEMRALWYNTKNGK